jgi:hypothetical protein
MKKVRNFMKRETILTGIPSLTREAIFLKKTQNSPFIPQNEGRVTHYQEKHGQTSLY